MPKSGSSMRYSESSQRRWPRYLECRGWIHQETLCNGISVTFDLRQYAVPRSPRRLPFSGAAKSSQPEFTWYGPSTRASVTWHWPAR